MDTASQLDAVLDLLERLGVEVRQARLGGEAGGLCVIRGTRVVFVDLDADPATRLDRCLTAVLAIPESESVFVPPQIRDLLDARGRESERGRP